MSLFHRWNKTSFKVDCNVNIKSPDHILASSTRNFVAPRVRDNRDLCLPANNQGDLPYCTGYATAGYCEVKYWKKYNYPKQFNAANIYLNAKKLDNLPSSDGSYIEYALEAALNLKYLDGTKDNIVVIGPTEKDIKLAIHTDDVFIGAFVIDNNWNYTKNGNIGINIDNTILGGHAVLVCGYDEDGIWIQNSWGIRGWGLYGFGHLTWKQTLTQFKYGVRLNQGN